MTVNQLIETLKLLPQDLPVCVGDSENPDQLADTVELKIEQDGDWQLRYNPPVPYVRIW